MRNKYPSDFVPVVNPAELLRKVDQKLFDLYRGGTVQLCVWRNSSPHNWWLSQRGNRDAIVYHWDEGMRPTEAFTAFSRRVDSKGDVVTYPGGFLFGYDAGMNVQDTWVYDEAVYQARVARWAESQETAKRLNAKAGSAPVDLTQLSPQAQQLVRGLKRQNLYPLSADNFQACEQLCAMGLAEVTPYAFIEGTEVLLRLKVPSKAALEKLATAAI